jgi:hypothetical protein
VRSPGSISVGPVAGTGEAPTLPDLCLAPGCGLPAAGSQPSDVARAPLEGVTDGRR